MMTDHYNLLVLLLLFLLSRFPFSKCN
jgi:hypothetical protein